MRRSLCIIAILSFSLFACKVEQEEPAGTQGGGEQEVQIQEQETRQPAEQAPREQEIQIQEQETQPPAQQPQEQEVEIQEQEIQPQEEQGQMQQEQ